VLEARAQVLFGADPCGDGHAFTIAAYSIRFTGSRLPLLPCASACRCRFREPAKRCRQSGDRTYCAREVYPDPQEGDEAIQLRIAGFIHLTHPSRAYCERISYGPSLVPGGSDLYNTRPSLLISAGQVPGYPPIRTSIDWATTA
jgi:hypothetical protein